MPVARCRCAADLERQQSHLVVSRFSAEWGTGSQCSGVFSNGVAWDRLGAWRTIQAALFCTR